MDKLIIDGTQELKGSVVVSSAKNATLPILAATLLFDGAIYLEDIPQLNDIHTLKKLLQSLGVRFTQQEKRLEINASVITSYLAHYDLVKTMRASVLVLGPLLSRFGEAKVSLPGGCAIGARPVDIHLSALEKMGAKIEIENGYIIAEAAQLMGTAIRLSFPSVGATENVMMAAVYAQGDTIIENAACEPEIVDLAHFLRFHDVYIEGEGTSRILIKGRGKDIIKPKNIDNYRVIGDRIEAATYIIAGLMTNSEIAVKGFKPDDLRCVLDILEKMGANFEYMNDGVKVGKNNHPLKGVAIETAPYPGFPTDIQAQMMALMSISEGQSIITENIFENRFMHVPEMQRMGAKIVLKGSSALVEGVSELSGAPVMCTDLRASAALILCALAAKGKSEIQRVYHLDRGYEKLELKLKNLGAHIERIK